MQSLNPNRKTRRRFGPSFSQFALMLLLSVVSHLTLNGTLLSLCRRNSGSSHAYTCVSG